MVFRSELRPFMLTGAETAVNWRRGQCLLLPDQGAAAFADECSGQGGRPLILYWGDSYAAAEYAGVEALRAEGGYDVAVYLVGLPAADGLCSARAAVLQGKQ